MVLWLLYAEFSDNAPQSRAIDNFAIIRTRMTELRRSER